MKLALSQSQAIELRGTNLQLIACAGSGTTEVVARRVVHLLRPDGGALAPRNMIAFTFTDKAAAELKERIVRRVRQALGDVVRVTGKIGYEPNPCKLSLTKFKVGHYRDYMPFVHAMEIDWLRVAPINHKNWPPDPLANIVSDSCSHSCRCWFGNLEGSLAVSYRRHRD